LCRISPRVRYGDSEDAYRLNAYATADGAVSYRFGSFSVLKDLKLTLTAQNLTNRRSIYDLAGYTSGSTPAGFANGNPLYFTIPGRSFQGTISASF